MVLLDAEQGLRNVDRKMLKFTQDEGHYHEDCKAMEMQESSRSFECLAGLSTSTASVTSAPQTMHFKFLVVSVEHLGVIS